MYLTYFNNDIQYGAKFIIKRLFDIVLSVIIFTFLLLTSCTEKANKISVTDQKQDEKTNLSIEKTTKDSNTKNKALFRLAFNKFFIIYNIIFNYFISQISIKHSR